MRRAPLTASTTRKLLWIRWNPATARVHPGRHRSNGRQAPRPANTEHCQPEHDDQRARDAVQPQTLTDQERSDHRCARAEGDEDREEADEEERARHRDLTGRAVPPRRELLEADSADRRDIRGHERQHARRDERDESRSEDKRQTQSCDLDGFQILFRSVVVGVNPSIYYSLVGGEFLASTARASAACAGSSDRARPRRRRPARGWHRTSGPRAVPRRGLDVRIVIVRQFKKTKAPRFARLFAGCGTRTRT